MGVWLRGGVGVVCGGLGALLTGEGGGLGSLLKGKAEGGVGVWVPYSRVRVVSTLLKGGGLGALLKGEGGGLDGGWD